MIYGLNLRDISLLFWEERNIGDAAFHTCPEMFFFFFSLELIGVRFNAHCFACKTPLTRLSLLFLPRSVQFHSEEDILFTCPCCIISDSNPKVSKCDPLCHNPAKAFFFVICRFVQKIILHMIKTIWSHSIYVPRCTF